MFVYHLLFPFVFAALAPVFLLRMWRRGNMGRGFGERFGLYPDAVAQKLAGLRSPVWIHAVSVGELLMARVLIRELRRLLPEQDLVLTCTTATARTLAERDVVDARTVVLHTPIDWLPVVRRAFARIRPALVVLMEQELWPGQMAEAERLRVPVWIVNARLSDRSHRRLRRVRRLVARILRPVVFVGLQRETDRARFAAAGFPVHALFLTGSLKCDVALLNGVDDSTAERLRAQLGWEPSAPVVLAGSTHPGEEELVLAGFRAWQAAHPDLKLVLAPRHAERAPEVLRLVREEGWPVVARSAAAPGADVAVLDTTGELAALYALARVVFIGKSLVAPEGKGGQNFLEAARCGCAVVAGPRMENFHGLAEEYTAAGAMVRVADAAGLAAEVGALLGDAERRARTGAAARALFEREAGVGARVAAQLASCLET